MIIAASLITLVSFLPQGPLAEMPLGVMSPSSTELQLIDESGGSQDITIELPQYSRLAILGSVVAGSELKFGSISRGHGFFSTVWDTGIFPVHETPVGGWAWLLYSVSSDSEGRPGGTISQHAGQSPSGYVYGHITDPSTGGDIPDEDTGTVVEVWTDAATPGVGAIEGLDSSLSALLLGDGIPDEFGDRFYFTLRGLDVAGFETTIPDSWGKRFLTGVPISGDWKRAATIFAVTQTGPTTWTEPRVYKTLAELDLPLEIDGMPTEIDGLTVMEPGGNTELLLSCAGTSDDHQLWLVGTYANPPAGQGPTYEGPLRAVNGTPYPIVFLGVNPGDNLRSLCAEDPGPVNGSGSPQEWRRLQFFGLPQVNQSATGNVNFNAHRVNISGKDYYRLRLYKQPGERAELFLGDPYAPSLPPSSLGFFGGSSSTVVRVLRQVPSGSLLSGTRFHYFWQLTGRSTKRTSHFREFYWEDN